MEYGHTSAGTTGGAASQAGQTPAQGLQKMGMETEFRGTISAEIPEGEYGRIHSNRQHIEKMEARGNRVQGGDHGMTLLSETMLQWNSGDYVGSAAPANSGSARDHPRCTV